MKVRKPEPITNQTTVKKEDTASTTGKIPTYFRLRQLLVAVNRF